jgi:tetraacyldisaccharide 4'-kinase
MKRPWLAPFVPLYATGLAWRNFRLRRGWEPVRRLQWPVISIGNLSTGGSGKTPLAITLAKLLQARGAHVDVLSRGYGRSSSEAMRVDPGGTVEQFGDEPLLIAREAGVPVYVASQRYDAGVLAETNASGQHDVDRSLISSAHVLDDGFQHRQLFRDVDILLLNREDWRDTLLPAGNLRETLHAAKRADVIAIPAGDSAFESELRRWGWTGPVWRLRRRMNVPLVGGPVYAFCGIARPEQFFAGLESNGLGVAACNAFRDHHWYTRKDVDRLIAAGRTTGAVAFVTTDKDAVRLGALASAFPPELPLKTAHLSIGIDGEASALDWLIGRLRTTASLPSV